MFARRLLPREDRYPGLADSAVWLVTRHGQCRWVSRPPAITAAAGAWNRFRPGHPGSPDQVISQVEI